MVFISHRFKCQPKFVLRESSVKLCAKTLSPSPEQNIQLKLINEIKKIYDFQLCNFWNEWIRKSAKQKTEKKIRKEILNTRRETIIVVRSGSESFQVSSPLFWIAVISVNARGPQQDPGTYPPGSYWILCSTGALTNKKANQNKNKTYNNQQTKARYFLLKSKEVRVQIFG